MQLAVATATRNLTIFYFKRYPGGMLSAWSSFPCPGCVGFWQVARSGFFQFVHRGPPSPAGVVLLRSDYVGTSTSLVGILIFKALASEPHPKDRGKQSFFYEERNRFIIIIIIIITVFYKSCSLVREPCRIVRTLVHPMTHDQAQQYHRFGIVIVCFIQGLVFLLQNHCLERDRFANSNGYILNTRINSFIPLI